MCEEGKRRGEGRGRGWWPRRGGKSGKIGGRNVAALDEDLFFVAFASWSGARGKTVAGSEERVIGHRPAILEHGETDEDSGIEGRNVRNAEKKEWKLRERGGIEKGNRVDRERERKREREREEYACVCVCV